MESLEEVKESQYNHAWMLLNIAFSIFNFAVAFIFATLNVVGIYTTHKLSRDQKKTQED